MKLLISRHPRRHHRPYELHATAADGCITMWFETPAQLAETLARGIVSDRESVSVSVAGETVSR